MSKTKSKVWRNQHFATSDWVPKPVHAEETELIKEKQMQTLRMIESKKNELRTKIVIRP